VLNDVTKGQAMSSNGVSESVKPPPSPLVGRFTHTLDPKRRLTIPAGWREQMGLVTRTSSGRQDYVFVMPDMHKRCLSLFSLSEMAPLIERLRGHVESGRRLRWIEAGDDADLLAAYRCSSVLLAASCGEGFGLPLVEAAASGLPILARDIAVFRTGDGRVFALEDRCPHRGGPLSQGIVHGHCVTCPLHDWVIDLGTGAAVAPDEGRARRFDVRVDEDRVLIRLEADTCCA